MSSTSYYFDFIFACSWLLQRTVDISVKVSILYYPKLRTESTTTLKVFFNLIILKFALFKVDWYFGLCLMNVNFLSEISFKLPNFSKRVIAADSFK